MLRGLTLAKLMRSNCVRDDNCTSIANKTDNTVASLVAWNPPLGTSSNCTAQPDTYICVGVPGNVTLTVGSTATGVSSATVGSGGGTSTPPSTSSTVLSSSAMSSSLSTPVATSPSASTASMSSQLPSTYPTTTPTATSTTSGSAGSTPSPVQVRFSLPLFSLQVYWAHGVLRCPDWDG